MRRFTKRFSPATVLALIALFVALAGTATAGSVALITGAQIKNGSITGADVKKKSLTAAHVRGASRGARGAAGPPGTPGPPGAPGTQGPAGVFSAANVTEVAGASVTMSPGGVGSSSATCPAGSVALSGGWDGEDHPPVDATVGYNKRYGTTTWGVIMVNWASIPSTYHALAVCAVAPAATAGGYSATNRAFKEDTARFAEAIRNRG